MLPPGLLPDLCLQQGKPLCKASAVSGADTAPELPSINNPDGPMPPYGKDAWWRLGSLLWTREGQLLKDMSVWRRARLSWPAVRRTESLVEGCHPLWFREQSAVISCLPSSLHLWSSGHPGAPAPCQPWTTLWALSCHLRCCKTILSLTTSRQRQQRRHSMNFQRAGLLCPTSKLSADWWLGLCDGLPAPQTSRGTSCRPRVGAGHRLGSL